MSSQVFAKGQLWQAPDGTYWSVKTVYHSNEGAPTTATLAQHYTAKQKDIRAYPSKGWALRRG